MVAGFFNAQPKLNFSFKKFSFPGKGYSYPFSSASTQLSIKSGETMLSVYKNVNKSNFI